MRAAEVQEAASKLRVLKGESKGHEVWRTLADSLEERAEAIRRPVDFLLWLRDTSAQGVDIDSTELLTTRRDAERLLAGLEGEPDRAFKRDLPGKAKASAERAAKDLEVRASNAWSAQLPQLPPLDAELYIGFRADPNLAPLVDEAEHEDQRYAKLRKLRYLDSVQLRDEFVALLQQRSATRAKLPDMHDNEVRGFVTAAAASGAPLAALTPKVVTWLTENGLLSSYVVYRRGPGIERGRRR